VSKLNLTIELKLTMSQITKLLGIGCYSAYSVQHFLHQRAMQYYFILFFSLSISISLSLSLSLSRLLCSSRLDLIYTNTINIIQTKCVNSRYYI